MDLLPHLRRWTGRAFLLALPVLAVTAWQRDRLPPPGAIAPALADDPRQDPTDREPFAFRFRDTLYRVEPVATYELRGLVVSESDAGGLGDMYHDARSANTKDICIAWGENLATDAYRRARFRSGSFTCRVSWPPGMRIRLDQVANNHLLTASDPLRQAIQRLRTGDQVRIAGLLVDYQREGWPQWRRTSKVRDDRLCEIVLVEEIEVLRSGNPLWRLLFRIAAIVVFAAPLVWLALVWVEAGRGGTTLGEL